jgi:hypothetical protein
MLCCYRRTAIPLLRLRRLHIVNEVTDINIFIYDLPLETAEND